MNPYLLIALVGTGVLIFNRLGTASAASRLNYVFDGVSWKFKDALTIQFDIDLGVQNPTSNSFVIKSFSGNLNLNGYYIGNVSNFTATEITANAQTEYRVSLQLSTLSLPTAILNLLQTFTHLSGQLQGTVNVDNLAVPVDLVYNKTI